MNALNKIADYFRTWSGEDESVVNIQLSTQDCRDIADLHVQLCRATERLNKYRWHDLRKNPEDLPENENYVIAKIKFYGKGSERYKSNCYTSGVYEQRPERWNLEQGHKWHDEYNPFVDYEVIKWKYIDEEVGEGAYDR